MTLGLVPVPELPERIAHGVAGELPGFLGERVDGTVSWEVPVVVGTP